MAPRRSPDVVGRWAAGLVALGETPEAVLAGVAAAVDVPWDGPGVAIAVGVPELPGWLLLDAAREALLAEASRRRLGAHHTPPDLARRLVALALEGVGPEAIVCDPSCGGGAFLVAAAEQLVEAGADAASVVGEQIIGLDIDPLAVATTRAALRCWARARGLDVIARGVVAGDGLVGPWAADAVVGNPPFLSPLGVATGGGAGAGEMRRSLAAPYADTAGLFLLRSLEHVVVGGRVLLIQPESLLSSRDARSIRTAIAPHLEGIWVAGEPVFGAAVRVCAPVLRRDSSFSGTSVLDSGTLIPENAPSRSMSVRRWRGASVRPTGSVRFDRAAATWSHLRPTTVPRITRQRGPTVGDLATATAGFRDEFYGLAAAVAEGGDGAPLITSGLIDHGRVAWAERAARIAGARYLAPTVELGALSARLRAWVDARLVPKVLVATQTKVVEAAPDPEGRLVPMTPVLSVVPHDPDDVWRLAAALTSPLVSAWALREFAGAALSANAIKLSAKQVLAAPLPADPAAWRAATDALRGGDVVGCGSLLAASEPRLLAWWRGRLPPGTV